METKSILYVTFLSKIVFIMQPKSITCINLADPECTKWSLR